MKEPLKVGDRVAIYGFAEMKDQVQISCYREKGLINRINGKRYYVEFYGLTYVFHEKQLRRIVPKKRRQIWVNQYKDIAGNYFLSEYHHESLELAKTKIAEGIDEKSVKTIRFFEGKEK